MTINTTDLTTVNINGTGVFDVLMRATVSHLEKEFQEGRITGANYTQLYLGGLQSVLSQASAYAMGKPQADAQAEVLKQQAANLVTENTRLNKEIERLTVEVNLANKQVLIAQAQYENLLKEGIKLTAETNLTNENVTNAQKQGAILDEQKDRTLAETVLVNQRVKSEQAQTQDAIDGVDVGGTAGKQMALYAAQTSGFARDAEQKALKVCSEMWSTAKTTDSTGLLGLPSELNEAGLNDLILKLKSGINL